MSMASLALAPIGAPPPAKFSIRDALHSYATGPALTKTWGGHDRLSTVGASEVGQCLRKTWFSKNETPPDPAYTDRFGAKLRGDLIEAEYWVPALRAHLGPRLLWAGEDQRTLVDGYLSATPDGLVVGADFDCLEHLGIANIGPSTCFLVECKSIDPRVALATEKPEHSFQTQAQMGLVRHATVYKPEVALISYVDASFLDDVTEFAVQWDAKVYAAAKSRATTVMTSTDPLTLPPEGKLSGGDECKYCPWASYCAQVTVAGVPAGGVKPPLGANAAAELRSLRDAAVQASEEADAAAAAAATAKEDIKRFLREHDSRGHRGEDWSVTWGTVKGRAGLDVPALEAAAQAAGLDLSPFQKTGDPYDRLVVK